MGKVYVVDENDEIIGLKERALLHPSDITRVSVLWLTNSNGEILMAQRSLEKRTHPGGWSASAGGMVDEGEDYDLNIIKETQEEIGLTLDPMRVVKGEKVDMTEDEFPCFMQWYSYVADVPLNDFVLQEEEVMAVRWYTAEELKDEVTKNPEKFTPLRKSWTKKFLDF